jgi:ribonuclease PH
MKTTFAAACLVLAAAGLLAVLQTLAGCAVAFSSGPATVDLHDKTDMTGTNVHPVSVKLR